MDLSYGLNKIFSALNFKFFSYSNVQRGHLKIQFEKNSKAPKFIIGKVKHS